VAVDHRCVNELELPEPTLATEHFDPAGGEPPIDVVVLGVDLAGCVAVHGLAIARIREDAVRLDQHPTAFRETAAEETQQSGGRLYPVQNPTAEDEVEALVESVELQRVELLVLDRRAE
jgi:hypothetical protein